MKRGGPRIETKAYLAPDTARALELYAARAKRSKSLVIEAALSSFLSPDSAERNEAALGRRLDRLSRQIERLERDTAVNGEALALFVRFWLTSIPPIPDAGQPAAQAKGRERYQDFVTTLGRRLAKGQSLSHEVSVEVQRTTQSNIADPGLNNAT